MKASGSKEQILKRIRKALEKKVPQPFSAIDNQSGLYIQHTEGLEMSFARNFTALGGHFMYCEDTSELVSSLAQLVAERNWSKIICKEENLNRLLALKEFKPAPIVGDLAALEEADVAITYCEALIGRTGSILLSSALKSGRTGSILPPVHIVIAFTSQVLSDIKEGVQLMKDRYPDQLPSMINFTTGPSRTADIEKTLVVGVHGPKEVFVFLVDESI
jgi:L-lactate dehydrogenase complex protein LldG